ncbi:hypothetical protein, partial [Desulfoluna spongiiphila]
EARIKAEEEAKKKAEEEARLKAEEEAKKKAEEEARLKAEEEARIKAEEEAKRQAELDAKKKAEAAARRKAAEEARAKAEEEARARNLEEKQLREEAAKKAATRKLITAACAFGVFVLILIAASASNTSNYYVAVKKHSTLIYKGIFSPTGKDLILEIPAPVALDTVKETYTLQEVKPLIFTHHMDTASALRDVAGVPDLEAIIASYEAAVDFAPGPEELNEALKQLEAAKDVFKAIQ